MNKDSVVLDWYETKDPYDHDESEDNNVEYGNYKYDLTSMRGHLYDKLRDFRKIYKELEDDIDSYCSTVDFQGYDTAYSDILEIKQLVQDINILIDLRFYDDYVEEIRHKLLKNKKVA